MASTAPSKKAEDAAEPAAAPDAAALATKERRVQALVAAGFLMSLCNTMQGVMYVPAAVRVSGGSSAKAAVLLGMMQSLCAGVDVFGSPLFGSWTDSAGRKAPLVITAITLALTRFWMVASQSKASVVLSRVVGYAASSFFSNTLNAALMDLAAGNKDDVVAYKQRDAGAKGWGVVFGPWLAGAVVKYRSGADFFVSGLVGAACAFWAQIGLPETLALAKRKAFVMKSKSLFSFMKLFGKSKDLNISLIMMFLSDVTLRTGAIFPMYTRAAFKWDSEITGRWLMMYGLGMAYAPGVLAKPLQSALSTRGMMYFNLVFAIFAESMLAVSQPLFHSGKLFWVSLAAFFVCLGKPSSVRALVTRAAQQALPDMGQGELAGCQSSIGSLSNLASPQVHARAFTYFSSDAAPFKFPSMPFAICATMDCMNVAMLTAISSQVCSWAKQKPKPKEDKKIADKENESKPKAA
jgi:DHA1 family tetracycline resistance protein-like MFS transporter